MRENIECILSEIVRLFNIKVNLKPVFYPEMDRKVKNNFYLRK